TIGDVLHLRDNFAKSCSGPQVKGERRGRQLPIVIDGLRAYVGFDPSQSVERDQLIARRLEVQQRKRARIGLVLGLELEQNLVLVDRAVNGRYPAGTVGVVKRVF